jgi:NAD+ synthase (glutamine-hydrolysing)
MKAQTNFTDLGFVRVAAVSPELVLGDPLANAERMAAHVRALALDHVSLVLFPELALTGYTCEDLFFSADLHRHTRAGLRTLAAAAQGVVCVVGAPWFTADGRLLNCAVVLAEGAVKGMVPKTAQPNYGEFYE